MKFTVIHFTRQRHLGKISPNKHPSPRVKSGVYSSLGRQGVRVTLIIWNYHWNDALLFSHTTLFILSYLFHNWRNNIYSLFPILSIIIFQEPLKCRMLKTALIVKTSDLPSECVSVKSTSIYCVPQPESLSGIIFNFSLSFALYIQSVTQVLLILPPKCLSRPSTLIKSESASLI